MVSKTSLLEAVKGFDWKAVDAGLKERPELLGHREKARVGAVTARLMLRHFKYAVPVVFVLAAVLTPSADAWNQIAFAAPMLALYLLSIGIPMLPVRQSRPRPAETTSGWSSLRP